MTGPILVLGASGMLGQALAAECGRRGLTFIGAARNSHPCVHHQVDMLDDRALLRLLDICEAPVVINAAAMVNLDACESDPGTAYRLNARLPAIVAKEVAARGGYFAHISTDHYFSGDGDKSHGETDPVRLLNEYARTKYAGECFALAASAWVVRTNIVGFRGHADQPTFVEWVLARLHAGEPMTLFDDYYTSSLAVDLFAAELLDALPKKPRGLINLAGAEVVSKRAFVEALAQAAGFSTANCQVASVTTLVGARRAESLGLDVGAARILLGHDMPTLSDTIQALLAEHGKRKACATIL